VLEKRSTSSGKSFRDFVSVHAVSISVILIIVITAGAFSSAVGNDFVNWDDPRTVVSNPLIRNLSWRGFLRMFDARTADTYLAPVVYLTYAIEYRFFGVKSAFIYHLDNVIIHIINSVLVFCFILILSRKIPVALIAALLFGVHPLNCESVAWVTERKDVLSALFYVLAMIFYLKARQKRFGLFFTLSIMSAVLSSLSKPMAVSLPFVLILCDILERRPLSLKAVVEKSPFFVFSCLFAAFTFHFQSQSCPQTLKVVEVGRNLLVSSKALMTYLSKTVVPVKLSILHPGPKEVSIGDPAYFLSLVGVAVILIVSMASLKKTRTIFFSVFFFLVTIGPVVGIVPISQHFIAERYMYIPSIGLFFLAAYYWHALYVHIGRGPKAWRVLLTGIMVVVIVLLGAKAYDRNKVWRSSGTLWQNALDQYPDSITAKRQLESYELRTGGFDAGFGKLSARIARMQYKQKLFGKAIKICEDAIKAGAGSAEIYLMAGDSHFELGNYDDAIKYYDKAVEKEENPAETYAKMGLAFAKKGEGERAAAHLKKAFELDGQLQQNEVYRLAYEKVVPE